MSWIEYHTQLRDHWKIQRLAAELSTDYITALGAISCLWLWCAEYAPSGKLSTFKDDEIRTAARISLEKFSKKTLEDCGLIDKRGRINDWSKHGLKLLESRRKRQREYQSRKRSTLRRYNVDSTSTIPNHTIPNQEKADHNYLLKNNINNLFCIFKTKEAVKKHLIGLGFTEHQICEALGQKY